MSRRLCWKGYASILRLLQEAPRTHGDIAEAMGAGIINLRRIVNRMHDLRLVHVTGWEKRHAKGRPQALWAFGAGVDAPWPEGQARAGFARHSKAKYLVRPELIAFAQMVRAMSEPVTRAELVELSGSTSANISRLMQHCKAIGLVHIAAWDTSKPGKPAECLQLGQGRAAPRPKPMTQSEINRRYRQSRAGHELARAITSALAGASNAPDYSEAA